MRIFNTILAFSLLGAVSCKKELEPQEPMYTYKDTLTATPATNAALSPTAPAVNPVAVQPSNTAPAQVAAGMNPPHGQPNHRCDIAVGAPLNSPVAKVAATAPKMSTQTVKPAQGAATVTAPGMNPPHGQPLHRCDIAVGSPLPKNDTAEGVPALDNSAVQGQQ